MSNILLNVKTDYEMLSSLIKIEDLINYALKNDIGSLGVTDSNLFSFMEFYNNCKKNNIKPIIGIDIELDNKKFLLYARNFNGYKSLCKIVSEKNINGLSFEYLKKYNKDIICVCFNLILLFLLFLPLVPAESRLSIDDCHRAVGDQGTLR